jgi:hypothetical protein
MIPINSLHILWSHIYPLIGANKKKTQKQLKPCELLRLLRDWQHDNLELGQSSQFLYALRTTIKYAIIYTDTNVLQELSTFDVLPMRSPDDCEMLWAECRQWFSMEAFKFLIKHEDWTDYPMMQVEMPYEEALLTIITTTSQSTQTLRMLLNKCKRYGYDIPLFLRIVCKRAAEHLCTSVYMWAHDMLSCTYFEIIDYFEIAKIANNAYTYHQTSYNVDISPRYTDFLSCITTLQTNWCMCVSDTLSQHRGMVSDLHSLMFSYLNDV